MSEALNSSDHYKSLPIVVGAESETGRREENQDHMTGFTSRFGAVYVVADGMGGHRGGAEASRMVTEGVRTHLLEAPDNLSLADSVRQAAQFTNHDLYNKNASGDPNFAGMGSTLSLVVIGGGDSGMQCVTAHVGDSRVYLERGGRLSVLTKDHTYVQKLLDSKIIDEEAARTHPDASILTRAMGQAPEVSVDISEPIQLADGDGILLCSDGLSGYVPHQSIEEAVRQHPSPSDCAKALVELALSSGSDDNVTVQFVRLGNPPQPPVPPRRNRKTQPEAEALSFPAGEPPARFLRRGSRRLLPAVAVALPLVAGGLFAFRHTLFTASPTFAGPYSKEMREAGDLNSLVIHLQGLVAKDLEQVKLHVNHGTDDSRLPEFGKLEETFRKLDGAMNDLEAKTQALPNLLVPGPGVKDTTQPPSRDPAKVDRFTKSYKSASQGFSDQQSAYNQAHRNLHSLESRPSLPRSSPPVRTKKKKRVVPPAEADGI